MSDEAKPKKVSGGAFSGLVAIVVIVLIAVVMNYMIGGLGLLNFRKDLTEDQLYTLSDGTKNILSKIDGDVPVTLRYYLTQDPDAYPAQIRGEFKVFTRGVEELLKNITRESDGKVVFEKMNPEPDSDDEDAAGVDGITPRSFSFDGEPIYHGLAVSCLEKQAQIPFIDPSRETMLEYDVMRAVSEVIRVSKPVVGLVAGLPVAGSGMPQMPPQFGGGGGAPPWFFYREMERDYEVRDLGMDLESIDPEDVGMVVVIHPAGLSVKSQFALDQYVLKGGSLIVAIDPYSIVARFNQPQPNPMMRGMQPPPTETSSNLPALLSAWGYSMDDAKVVGDLTYRTQVQGGRRMAAFLTLPENAFNEEDVVTSRLSQVNLVFAGGLEGAPVEGLEETVLLTSSTQSAMVSPFDAEQSDASVLKKFVSGEKEIKMAVRLSGKFRTAFPEGAPEEPEAPGAEAAAEGEEEEEAPADFLTEGNGKGMVLVVTDCDWLNDQFCVDLQEIGNGLAIPQLINSNLAMMQNSIEQMSGDPDLIAVRSRSETIRPFTVFEKLNATAEQKFSTEVEKYEQEREQTERRMNELLRGSSSAQEAIMSDEFQEEYAQLAEKNREVGDKLRGVRKELKKEVDTMQSRLTLANIFSVPGLVAWFGVMLAVWRKFRTGAK